MPDPEGLFSADELADADELAGVEELGVDEDDSDGDAELFEQPDIAITAITTIISDKP
jgi:hypothetical protein